ncbi:MAG: monofunctional biosynthetic peptidoglycan transglycosylase [Bacteroidales bacterium]|nr:monofunctional biosynthetic peptidoglycan transglycosylase [Bacteroidales bacterium]
MPEERKQTKRRLWRLLLVKIPVAFVALTVLWVLVLKWCPVVVTPLMIQRSIEFRADDSFKTRHKWVPLEKISPEVAKAVIASEDNLFETHNGFDTLAIRQAREEVSTGKRKQMRGASTISQQTAKNVFLLPTRSYVRKGLEAYFTFLIEKIWGKQRILEVYLNVIETGKGIYGVEASARQFFDTTASGLGKRQSCLIAACLPNPLKRDVTNPSSYVSSRARQIAALEPKLKYPDWIYEMGKK